MKDYERVGSEPKKRCIRNASPEEKEEMLAKIAQGYTYKDVADEYGFHRETIRRLWHRAENFERNAAVRKEGVRQRALLKKTVGGLTEIVDCPISNAKVDLAFDQAVDELICRLTGESAHTIRDQDLISAIRLLWDIKKGRSGEDVKTQHNTQNIINIFEQAIEDTIQQHNYEQRESQN